MFKNIKNKIWNDCEWLNNVSRETMKGGEENVKIILYVGLLVFNLIIILCQQAKISSLLEELQQLRIETIKEINKYRKED